MNERLEAILREISNHLASYAELVVQPDCSHGDLADAARDLHHLSKALESLSQLAQLQKSE